MKRYFLLAGIAMLFSISLFAQDVENSLPKNQQARLDIYFPVTDSLVFSLPNEGTLVLLYNENDYSLDSLESIFGPLLEEAKKFPEFKTITYRLSEQYAPTSISKVKLDIEKKYIQHLDSIELGFPIGLDFMGGHFTPEIGFEVALTKPGFQIGASITNSVYFPENENSEITVNSNWFLNAEFAWKPGRLYPNHHQVVQIGYLVNSDKSELFQGTTLKAIYRQSLNRYLSVQGGIVGTNNLKTYYPTVGFRIRF